MSDTLPVTLDDVRDAARRIEGVGHRTPSCAPAPWTPWPAPRSM